MSVKKNEPVMPQFPCEAYGHVISPLTVDDGGGYMIAFPDLFGCMSDGETLGEVLVNGRDAFNSWIAAQVDMGRQIPEPTHYDEEGKPIKFVQRLTPVAPCFATVRSASGRGKHQYPCACADCAGAWKARGDCVG